MLDAQARTQLQSLVGCLEVLQQAPVPPAQRNRLDEAVQSVLDVLDELGDRALARVFNGERLRRYSRTSPTAGAGTPRALIVEDDPTNTRVAIDMLNVLGLEADSVATGEEALDRVDTGEYDIVLMDVMLPAASGIEITAEIRKRSVRQPFIVGVTALPAAEKESIAAGMDAFLAKPMRLNEIAKTLGLGNVMDRAGEPSV
ncbi:response regulator [Rubrivirga sp.]|uniref:response regulator n=1 Tax=Rubrivirga sp. TaxID=1885344 RepID=UPI003C787C45